MYDCEIIKENGQMEILQNGFTVPGRHRTKIRKLVSIISGYGFQVALTLLQRLAESISEQKLEKPCNFDFQIAKREVLSEFRKDGRPHKELENR